MLVISQEHFKGSYTLAQRCENLLLGRYIRTRDRVPLY